MHVAIDGSPLVEEPNSPISLHTIEWISVLRQSGLEVTVLHPQGPLPWMPPGTGTVEVWRRSTGWGRLRMEQRGFPRAAGELQADFVLVGEDEAPLASPSPVVSISSLRRQVPAEGIAEKLAMAAGRAGSQGASARLQPSDLTIEPGRTGYTPFVEAQFDAKAQELGEPFVLCFGFEDEDVSLILAAWTWVDGSLGDAYPLVFLGPNAEQIERIETIAAELEVLDSIRTRAELSYPDLPQLYAGAAAYLGTTFAAGGQALRWALAAGTPIVGIKTPEFESVVGEAAYLVPPENSRTLGAACLTVLIQERVSEPLREKGLERALNYGDGSQLAGILRNIAKQERGAAIDGD